MGDTARVQAGQEREMLETMKAMRPKPVEQGENKKGTTSCHGSPVAKLLETEQLCPRLAVKTHCWGYWRTCARAEEVCPGVPTITIKGGQGPVQAEGGVVLPAAGSSPPRPACIRIPPDSAGRNPWGPQQQLLV